MKKNTSIYIFLIIIGIVLSNIIVLVIYKNYNYRIDIQISNQGWANYDESLKNIKNNMDSITQSNDDFYWWTLKDFNIDDEEYQKTLNILVADVRMCYLDYTDDGFLYTNSNPIRNYRDKQYITKKELKKLNLDMYNDIYYGGCLKRFDDFNTTLISNNIELKNKILSKTNQIFAIKSTNMFTNKEATYNELLMRKTLEVHFVEDISALLVEEYNRLK